MFNFLRDLRNVEEGVSELDFEDNHEISRHLSRERGREEKGEGKRKERGKGREREEKWGEQSLKCGAKLAAQWCLCLGPKQGLTGVTEYEGF